MDLTPEELQQLLRLSLAALRAQAGGDGAAALPAALQAAAAAAPSGGPTLSTWLQTFERIIAERGYKAQTLRNRRTALAHIKRLWGDKLLRKAGGGPIEVSSLSTRFAEVIAAVMGDADPGARIRPSLHEARSLAARLYHAQGVDVQTLLGHKHAEMTEIYRDDRGLSAHEWKRVQACTVQSAQQPAKL